MPESQDWGAQPVGQTLFSSAFALNATEAQQTTSIVAGVAGKVTVLYLAWLLPLTNVPAAGTGLRDTVQVRLQGSIGGTAVGYLAISPDAPFAFVNVPQGILGQLQGEGIDAVYIGAPGAGKQGVTLFLQFYRST